MGIILLFITMGLLSCATLPKKLITGNDLPILKGKWDGTRTVGTGVTALTELEIYNDTIPLKGKLMAHNVLVRGASGGTVTLDFNNGLINPEGNFIIKSGQDVIELSLYQGEGKMKLQGDYYMMGAKGMLVLYKKSSLP